ncbi:MAG: hypothetical protein ABW318_23550 [Vicinamibacterales bacterium]
MHGCDNGRARDARLMNGVTLLGGRGASALEVDIALGIDPRPAQTSGLGTWLRALVARCAVVRETQIMSAKWIGIPD